MGSYPIGLTHDELNYIISSKSILTTGKFAPGTAPSLLPVSMNHYDVVIAEVPALLMSIFVAPFKFSLLTGRYPSAILAFLTVIVLYKLTDYLFKNKRLAFLVGLAYSLNPWSILTGRTAFEVNYFVFFFFTGLLILLRNRTYRKFWSLPLFILGFVSYTGGQLAFMAFVVASLFYVYLTNKAKLLPLIIYTVLVISIGLFFTTSLLRNQSFKSRGGEIFLPNNYQIVESVNNYRYLAKPSILNSIFVNKATVYFQEFSKRLISMYSPVTLFINGEYRAAFSLQTHGTFYLVDFVLIIFGLGFLYHKNRKLFAFFVVMFVFLPITSGLSNVEFSYSQRSGLIYPILIILVAMGMYSVCYDIFPAPIRKVIITIFGFVYLLSFANLIHLYFYRFPVYASDGWFFQDRLMSRYINLVNKISNKQNIIIVTPEPKIIFEEYLFYSHLYDNKEQINEINNKLNDEIYQIDNVMFISECDNYNMNNPPDPTYIFDASLDCIKEKSSLKRITNLKDNGEKYFISNDRLCGKYNLNRYVLQSAFSDFGVEKLDEDAFCENWITTF